MSNASNTQQRNLITKKSKPTKKKVAAPKKGARNSAKAEDTTDDPLRGMARAFAVLDLLASHPSRVVDVTRTLNLPWATVHRTLLQLEKAQFLRRNPDTNRYEIGPRLWHIGSAYLANHPVLRVAAPYLAAFDAEVDIAIQVVERINYQSVVIYSHQHASNDIAKAQYGFHFPLHAGSKGLVLLAYERPEFVKEYLSRDLEQLTPDTITDVKRLQAELKSIRAEGISRTVGDVQPHTASISTPIRDGTGDTIACVSFVFRKSMIKNAQWYAEQQDKIFELSHSISTDLGWRPGSA